MNMQTLAPSSGMVRLKLETLTGHQMIVGPLGSLGGAKRLAEDLLSEQPAVVRTVRVEHHNAGTWRPAWSFTKCGAALWVLSGLALTLLLGGCGFKIEPSDMRPCRSADAAYRL